MSDPIRESMAEQGVPMELPEAVAKPCSECPWRRASASGWLGPQTTEEWLLSAHSETPIMCHSTIKESGSYDGTKQCRGAAIFRANVAKCPRRSDMAVGPQDKETVFADNNEFTEHHNKNRVFEIDGWQSGDFVRLVENLEFHSEGEEGEIEIQQVGDVMYHNLALKMFFKDENEEEAIDEVEPHQIEEA